jgi:monothiol glutaredoxin
VGLRASALVLEPRVHHPPVALFKLGVTTPDRILILQIPVDTMLSLRYLNRIRHALPLNQPGAVRAFSSGTGASTPAYPGETDGDAGTHSDFAPVRKTAPENSQERIAQHLRDSKVVLYMKGSPTAPACGFSWKTVQILGAMSVPFKSYNVLEDEALRQGIKQYSAWPTIPQLYVDGEFVGGSDIVEGMAKNGELRTVLERAGVDKESAE